MRWVIDPKGNVTDVAIDEAKSSFVDVPMGKCMADVLKMTDKLEAELPTMLSEHQDIVAALKTLIDAASAENKPNVVHFAEKLLLHAQSEEQVAYPTALLIGRYVKSRLAA